MSIIISLNRNGGGDCNNDLFSPHGQRNCDAVSDSAPNHSLLKIIKFIQFQSVKMSGCLLLFFSFH